MEQQRSTHAWHSDSASHAPCGGHHPCGLSLSRIEAAPLCDLLPCCCLYTVFVAHGSGRLARKVQSNLYCCLIIRSSFRALWVLIGTEVNNTPHVYPKVEPLSSLFDNYLALQPTSLNLNLDFSKLQSSHNRSPTRCNDKKSCSTHVIISQTSSYWAICRPAELLY